MINIKNLPGLRETVEKYGIFTKKSLGQNFLFDLNLTAKIARSAGNLEGKTVLEIGAGPGGLTRNILAHGAAKVIAVEKDKRCAEALKELAQVSDNKLVIIEADALKIDEKEICSTDNKCKIIANLPYNIATELLFKWLDRIYLFESLTLMFQKEVAERIMAKPHTKEYGRVSILSQLVCEVRKEFDIPPEAFFPPPKVTSTVITMIPQEKNLADVNMDNLRKILAASFNQRRKMLRNSLKQIMAEPEKTLYAAGISPESRPEELSIEKFCRLAGEKILSDNDYDIDK